MSRRTITTIAAAGLITLSVFSGAGPANAQNTDPSDPSITLEGEFGGGANQIPDAYTIPDSGSGQATEPYVGGGEIQYETEDGTPLNLQNADGTPLDITAIPPGGSVEIYGPAEGYGPGEAPQLPGKQQIPGGAPQSEVSVPVITAEEMAAVEKSQKEFADMVLLALIGFSLLVVTAVVLTIREVRKRRNKKRNALADEPTTVTP